MFTQTKQLVDLILGSQDVPFSEFGLYACRTRPYRGFYCLMKVHSCNQRLRIRGETCLLHPPKGSSGIGSILDVKEGNESHELLRMTAALSAVSGLDFSTVLEGGEPSSTTGNDLARSDAAYYVASDGKDQNSGTRRQPFSTLGEARDIVRKLRRPFSKPVRILLRQGTYYLPESLILGAKDSERPRYETACIKSSALLVFFCLLVVFSAGCMKVQQYHPIPLTPKASAASLQARTLSNPALEKFLVKNLGHTLASWPAKSWNLKMLTLAAVYYSPALQQARAQVSAAKAAIITANERPNPTFRLRPGIPSPYLYTLDLLFNVRTAGRRKIMVEQAKDLSTAARLNLARATWKVYSNVRAALVSYFLATHEVGLLRLKQRLQTRRVSLLRARFVAGEISRPMVDNARLSLLQMHVAMDSAEGRIPETRAAVAAAIGVPVAALKGIQFVWPDFSQPPNAKSISSQSIQRDAVLNRLDVREALAKYAASQAALQLQIARQHSNILIGPGYSISGDYFRLRYAVTLPIFNRNQGPIAQAEAQRKEAAAAFLATQANAIAQSEEALARYRAAWRQLRGADDALTQLEHVVIPKERRTVAAGEAGRLALNAVLFQRPGMAQTWLAALVRTQTALGALEDAIQRPLEPDEVAWPAPTASHNRRKRVP